MGRASDRARTPSAEDSSQGGDAQIGALAQGADQFQPGDVVFVVSPDMSRLNIEGPYGDIMSRPGLDLKSRGLANVAAFTALADARPALKFDAVDLERDGVVEPLLDGEIGLSTPLLSRGHS